MHSSFAITCLTYSPMPIPCLLAASRRASSISPARWIVRGLRPGREGAGPVFLRTGGRSLIRPAIFYGYIAAVIPNQCANHIREILAPNAATPSDLACRGMKLGIVNAVCAIHQLFPLSS
jgi:hypothetical protein